MSYQSLLRTAMRTTLVLLSVCLSAVSASADTNSCCRSTRSKILLRKIRHPRPRQPSASRPQASRQVDQGRRYGQPGFVGEPINLNVVNADIRDILNYITEQYGVNFVIDSSVGAVPVTVNVQDVPAGMLRLKPC